MVENALLLPLALFEAAADSLHAIDLLGVWGTSRCVVVFALPCHQASHSVIGPRSSLSPGAVAVSLRDYLSRVVV